MASTHSESKSLNEGFAALICRASGGDGGVVRNVLVFKNAGNAMRRILKGARGKS